MNRRIKALAKKADPEFTGKHDDNMGHCLVGNEAIEKFSKLIINKCADLTRWKDLDMSAEQRIRLSVYHDIKEYFGVKE